MSAPSEYRVGVIRDELVTEEMWRHEAENLCAQHFKIPIRDAIYLVDEAVQAGAIVLDLGMVRPAAKRGV